MTVYVRCTVHSLRHYCWVSERDRQEYVRQLSGSYCVCHLSFSVVCDLRVYFFSLCFLCVVFSYLLLALSLSLMFVLYVFVCLSIYRFVGLFFSPFLLFLLFLYLRPSLSLPLLFLSAPYPPPPPLRPSAPLRPSTPIHRQCLQVLEGALTLPSEMQPPPPSLRNHEITYSIWRKKRSRFFSLLGLTCKQKRMTVLASAF